MRPSGRLALSLQEVLTVTVRLRSNKQVAADAGSFRRHVKQLLASAGQEVREAGLDAENVRLAVYACIAFLDESVLNSRQPMFSEWARQPLQQEIFGDLRAGETFYDNLDELLSRRESAELAEVLEVYLLCLLLGFRGRYGSDESTERRSLISASREKLQHIRGSAGDLSPSWAPPADEEIPALDNPWVRRLSRAAVVSLGVVVVLFIIFWIALSRGVGQVERLV